MTGVCSISILTRVSEAVEKRQIISEMNMKMHHKQHPTHVTSTKASLNTGGAGQQFQNTVECTGILTEGRSVGVGHFSIWPVE